MVLGRGAVAARKQGGLASMEVRIEQGNAVVDQAHENQRAALLEQVNRCFHGASVARAIEDQHGRLFLTRLLV